MEPSKAFYRTALGVSTAFKSSSQMLNVTAATTRSQAVLIQIKMGGVASAG